MEKLTTTESTSGEGNPPKQGKGSEVVDQALQLDGSPLHMDGDGKSAGVKPSRSEHEALQNNNVSQQEQQVWIEQNAEPIGLDHWRQQQQQQSQWNQGAPSAQPLQEQTFLRVEDLTASHKRGQPYPDPNLFGEKRRKPDDDPEKRGDLAQFLSPPHDDLAPSDAPGKAQVVQQVDHSGSISIRLS